MYRRWLLGVPALAAATLLVFADHGQAQGRYRGRAQSGFSFGYGSGYGYGFGNPMYYGYGYPGYANGYSSGYYPGTWNSGYAAPYRTFGYDNYQYYNQPQYYSSPATYATSVPLTTSSSLYSPERNTPENAALIDVQVPPSAQLWFSGTTTNQSGPRREFVTPSLEPGQKYTYEVRARWMDNGQEIDQTRKVHVRAGERLSVDFTRAEPAPSAPGSVVPRDSSPQPASSAPEGNNDTSPAPSITPTPAPSAPRTNP